MRRRATRALGLTRAERSRADKDRRRQPLRDRQDSVFAISVPPPQVACEDFERDRRVLISSARAPTAAGRRDAARAR